jgi:predicted nucleotidyltransferase
MILRECLKKQKQILESQGYTVCYLAVYGSQNYGLDIYTEEYQSDIDMKAIIVPTLDDLVRNSKPVSVVVDTEWGQCDIKDIRTYFQTLLKANPAYVETIYTNHCIVDDKFINEFNKIFKLRDKLMEALSAQFVRSIYGMMCEKEKAMCHPYPSIAHKIEEFGYCGKQVHHLYRLWLVMVDYYRIKKPLKDCFLPRTNEIGFLLNLKLNKFDLDYAKGFAKSVLEDAKEEKDEILSSINEKRIDYSIKDTFISISQDIIKNKIIDEIKTGDK